MGFFQAEFFCFFSIDQFFSDFIWQSIRGSWTFSIGGIKQPAKVDGVFFRPKKPKCIYEMRFYETTLIQLFVNITLMACSRIYLRSFIFLVLNCLNHLFSNHLLQKHFDKKELSILLRHVKRCKTFVSAMHLQCNFLD